MIVPNLQCHPSSNVHAAFLVYVPDRHTSLLRKTNTQPSLFVGGRLKDPTSKKVKNLQITGTPHPYHQNNISAFFGVFIFFAETT
jgi:hypothetical protein